MSTIAERVARGAAWLDENQPEWLGLIDLGQLRLSSPCRCMLGQLYEDYFFATFDLPGSAQEFGFNAHVDNAYSAKQEAEYAALEAEWRRVIAERRAAS